MKLEDIQILWDQDSKINPVDLATESLRVPELHNKYYKIYTQERLLLNKWELELKVVYKEKYEYYMGIMDEEDLKTNGWEPFALKVLKADLPIYMESDLDMVNTSKKIVLQKEKINFLESIIKNLNNRGFLIKNAIDWNKFTNGS
ncbi:MAG: hypothetical protein EBR82_31010 [Caulobacteraceae bacterium]|nr:hypothetical protein [Caulobacteraceae bacterium]NDG32985.1 hypothetical protein [bacterium]